MEKEIINLKDLEVENILGKKEKTDVSKDFAQMLFRSAQSLEVHVASQDLYKSGKCEKSKEVVEALKALVKEAKPTYSLRIAIEQILA